MSCLFLSHCLKVVSALSLLPTSLRYHKHPHMAFFSPAPNQQTDCIYGLFPLLSPRRTALSHPRQPFLLCQRYQNLPPHLLQSLSWSYSNASTSNAPSISPRVYSHPHLHKKLALVSIIVSDSPLTAHR
jgi:hypothetical protein